MQVYKWGMRPNTISHIITPFASTYQWILLKSNPSHPTNSNRRSSIHVRPLLHHKPHVIFTRVAKVSNYYSCLRLLSLSSLDSRDIPPYPSLHSSDFLDFRERCGPLGTLATFIADKVWRIRHRLGTHLPHLVAVKILQSYIPRFNHHRIHVPAVWDALSGLRISGRQLRCHLECIGA